MGEVLGPIDQKRWNTLLILKQNIEEFKQEEDQDKVRNKIKAHKDAFRIVLDPCLTSGKFPDTKH